MRLASEGAIVAVHDGTRREAANEVVSIIEAAGGTAFAISGVL